MASQSVIKHRNTAIIKILKENGSEKLTMEVFAAVGREFNLTGQQVRKIAVDSGVLSPRKHSDGKKSLAALVEIVRETPAGERRDRAKQLAEEAGRSAAALIAKCHAEGIDMLRAGGSNIDTAFTVLAKYKALGNMTEVASEMSVSKQFVSQIIAKARKAGAM